MLTDYCIGMRSALKMRPREDADKTKDDYALVEKHLALFAVA